MTPKVAIIYLSFHCEPYMPQVVNALEKLTYPKDRLAFVIVDNPHPVHGSSVEYIQREVLPKSSITIPETVLIVNDENFGFAEGNNRGAEWAIEHGYDYIYFHNSDACMLPACVEPLVGAMEKDHDIAIAQSLLLLYPENEKINSSGNELHFLGFGYCGNYKKRVSDVVLPEVLDIPYASGASMLVSTKFVQEYGVWDNDFFLYHEDTDFSLRARIYGYRVVLARESLANHQYEFKKSISKYYWMERNRFAILLMYYRWPTLLLFLPGLIAVELGTLLISFKTGWWKEKVKVYRYWLNPTNWKIWLKKRKKIQLKRKINDRKLLQHTTGKILFQEEAVESPILKYLANPVLSVYCWVVKKIVFW